MLFHLLKASASGEKTAAGCIEGEIRVRLDEGMTG